MSECDSEWEGPLAFISRIIGQHACQLFVSLKVLVFMSWCHIWQAGSANMKANNGLEGWSSRELKHNLRQRSSTVGCTTEQHKNTKMGHQSSFGNNDSKNILYSSWWTRLLRELKGRRVPAKKWLLLDFNAGFQLTFPLVSYVCSVCLYFNEVKLYLTEAWSEKRILDASTAGYIYSRVSCW